MQTDATSAAGQRGRDSSAYARAASLSGALLQRGRSRAPRLGEVPPVPRSPEAAPAPLLASAPEEPVAPPALVPAPAFVAAAAAIAPEKSSRFADFLFAAICCAAFFMTFLFFFNL